MSQIKGFLALCLLAMSFLRSGMSENVTLAGSVPYATYFGGSRVQVNALAVDAAGNIYLAGSTTSASLAGTAGVYQPVCRGNDVYPCADAFVAKVSSTGALLWSTYLGGGALDAAYAVAADSSGNIYVAGVTGSSDFPVTPDALRAVYSPPANALGTGFLVKFDASGSRLLYSTFLSGSDRESVSGLLAAGGSLYVAGTTTAAAFPVVSAPQTTIGGGSCGSYGGARPCSDAFLMRWRASDMKLLSSTFLGGSGNDSAAAVAVDAAGNIYATGRTNSPDFPLKNSLPTAAALNCPERGGTYPVTCPDAFVVKLSPDGSTVLYSTRLGGSWADAGQSIAADDSGSAFVVGTTGSGDFPLVHAAQAYPGRGVCVTEDSSPPCPHGFAAKLSPDGSLLWSTYLGSGSADFANATALDPAGNLYVAGNTVSSSFPVTPGAFRHCNASMIPGSFCLAGRAG